MTWRVHQLCLRVPDDSSASQGDSRLLALKDRKCADTVLIHVALRSNLSACFHLRSTTGGIDSNDSVPPASSYRDAGLVYSGITLKTCTYLTMTRNSFCLHLWSGCWDDRHGPPGQTYVRLEMDLSVLCTLSKHFTN